MNAPHLAIFLLLSAATAIASPQLIRPTEVWKDNRGQHIQAHGGGILKVGDTWYWFGEDRSRGLPEGTRAVACYASKDLVNWQFRRQVIRARSPESGAGRFYVLERPKVFHNPKTGRFVMYVHLDSANYKYARVGVYVSDTVDGQYKFVRSFRPLGQESRDIGQFVDDDGSAYLIFESRPTKGFYIAKLSDDYMDVEKAVSFVHAPLEGGGLVHYDGLYYLIGSKMTGWEPNPNVFATSKILEGPWTVFDDIAPPEANTYGAQSTMMVKVAGSKTTTVIFMGDMWKPQAQWDSRYLWMPLEIGNGRLHLPAPRPWTLDAVTGEALLKP
jgi:beta-xylosidase